MALGGTNTKTSPVGDDEKYQQRVIAPIKVASNPPPLFSEAKKTGVNKLRPKTPRPDGVAGRLPSRPQCGAEGQGWPSVEQIQRQVRWGMMRNTNNESSPRSRWRPTHLPF